MTDYLKELLVFVCKVNVTVYECNSKRVKPSGLCFQCAFTSDALRASACSSSVCAWVVKPWCSSRLAALVRDKWRWEGGAELKTWRRHCRARLPLPLARQNRAASFWTCQRGTVAYIYTNKLLLDLKNEWLKMGSVGSNLEWFIFTFSNLRFNRDVFL